MNHDFEDIPPKAFALLESLRSFGYSLSDSLADLIDNCIVAKATEIRIQFLWDGEHSKIIISDNGLGMSYEDLKNAMSLGVNGPSSIRSEFDLGRFGLGLKTASLSQARSMKVFTRNKSEKKIYGLCWDLDIVKNDSWSAIKLTEENLTGLTEFESPSGTIVVLEKLDRILNSGSIANNDEDRNYFYSLADEVKLNVGMIFHRFISDHKLVIRIGRNEVEAFDPLHLESEDTSIEVGEPIKVKGHKVEVKSVLISKGKVEDEKKIKHPQLERQGIFVYRNNRLVSSGKWLGLASGNNSDYKISRISLDFSSFDDVLWNIDVKKTSVTIPRKFSKILKNMIKSSHEKARELTWNSSYNLKRTPRNSVPLWIMGIKDGTDILILNREHHLIKSIKDSSSEANKNIEALLKLVELSLWKTFNEENSSYESLTTLNSTKETNQD